MVTPERSVAGSQLPIKKRLVTWVAAISLPVIALGNFSEAVMLVETASDRVVSTFTHLPEYQDLSRMRSGIAREYARDIFGTPQVLRRLNDSLDAEYYFKGKYLLTLFVRNQEVAGFTVISLRDGFAPEVFSGDGGGLGQFRLADIPGEAGDFRIDWTKTSALYLEEVNLGESSLNQKALMGWLNYGAPSGVDSEALGDLYRSVVLGKDEQVNRQLVRSATYANLYGWGRITLRDVRESVLSPSDLGHYLSAYQH